VPNLSLDTVISSLFFHIEQWTPALTRNHSPYLLRHILSKMWFPCHGNLFNGRIRASQAALADDLDLTREWTNKLIKKLRDAGWIKTYAPRKPNGKYQEITIFQIGNQLKRLLKKLLNSKQRSKNYSVNSQTQLIPTKEQVEKNITFLRNLQHKLGEQLAMQPAIDKKRRL